MISHFLTLKFLSLQKLDRHIVEHNWQMIINYKKKWKSHFRIAAKALLGKRASRNDIRLALPPLTIHNASIVFRMGLFDEVHVKLLNNHRNHSAQ